MKGWFSATKEGTKENNYDSLSTNPDLLYEEMLELMDVEQNDKIFRMMENARWCESNGMGMQPLSFPALESFARIYRQYDVSEDDMQFMCEMSEEYVKWHNRGREGCIHPGRHEDYEDLVAIQDHFEKMK